MRRISVGHLSDPAGAGFTGWKAGKVSLAVAFACAAGPALAQSFTPPAACDAFLTVQAKDCRVATYWTCPSDPGDMVWEGVHDADGGYSLAQYDGEFQWIDVRYFDGWRDRLAGPATDPISMTDMLARGWDTYEFELLSETGTAADGVTRIGVRGLDILTGETEVIDGETLLKTRYQVVYTGPEGGVQSVVSGAQYFSPVHRLFFLGMETMSDAEGSERHDSSPVAFVYPGEPGFADIRPAHGCSDSDGDAGKKAAGGKG